MNSPDILLLFNQPVLPPGHPDYESELEILATVDQVRAPVESAGFTVRTLAVGRDPQPLLDVLRDDPPDAVFNLFEGLADQNHTEYTAAGLMEWFDVSFTGSPAHALALARDKVRTKYLLHGAGLPTPPFVMIDELPCPPCPLEWPVIVKPATQDASVGIEQTSVVTSAKQYERQVARVLERFGAPVLVEKFISGRELLVSVIEENDGLTVLPFAEILFLEQNPSYWPIYSYDAKWRTDSHEYFVTPLKSPVDVEPAIRDRIAALARQAYRLVGCRDFARVDLRLTPAGEPYILEVNPNPFLCSLALINGLDATGRKHPDFVVDLVRAALRRRPTRTVPAAATASPVATGPVVAV